MSIVSARPFERPRLKAHTPKRNDSDSESMEKSPLRTATSTRYALNTGNPVIDS